MGAERRPCYIVFVSWEMTTTCCNRLQQTATDYQRLPKNGTKCYRLPQAATLSSEMCAKKRDIGIFLFSDVMIVARKLMKNRKYRILTTINVDDKLIVGREECEVAFQNGDISYAVNFSDLANGRMWEEYANYCKEALHVNITRDKTDQAVSCS